MECIYIAPLQFMPLIHPFTHTLTHQRWLAAMQGTSQLLLCLLRIYLEELSLLSVSPLYTPPKVIVHMNSIIYIFYRLPRTGWVQVQPLSDQYFWRSCRENALPQSMHFLIVLNSVKLQMIKEPKTDVLLRWQLKSNLANDITFPTVYNLLGLHFSPA